MSNGTTLRPYRYIRADHDLSQAQLDELVQKRSSFGVASLPVVQAFSFTNAEYRILHYQHPGDRDLKVYFYDHINKGWITYIGDGFFPVQ